MTRIFAVNGKLEAMASWFLKYCQWGIALVVEAIARGDMRRARQQLLEADADSQAATRRFAVGLCKEGMLVTAQTVQALRLDAEAKAAAGLARRRAVNAE